MATRSIIRIWRETRCVCVIYRHWDGYPSQAVRIIERYHALFDGKHDLPIEGADPNIDIGQEWTYDVRIDKDGQVRIGVGNRTFTWAQFNAWCDKWSFDMEEPTDA